MIPTKLVLPISMPIEINEPDPKGQADDEILWAELIDEKSDEKKAVPRLWIPGWVAVICGLIGLAVSFWLIRYELARGALLGTATIVLIGLGLSVASLYKPQYVGGRPRRVAAALCLAANLCVAILLIGVSVLYAFRHEIGQAVQRQRAEQQRQAQRNWQIQRREHANKLRQEQEQRLQEAQRLRTQQQLAEQKRLETFATGAADALVGHQMVQYRDQAPRAERLPLKIAGEVTLNNGQILYLDEAFDECAYVPGSDRLVALRKADLVAINLAERAVVRRLPLTLPARSLVAMRDTVALKYGRRVLLADGNLRPIRSFPGERFERLIARPSSPYLWALARRDTARLSYTAFCLNPNGPDPSFFETINSAIWIEQFALFEDRQRDFQITSSGYELIRWTRNAEGGKWLPPLIDQVKITPRPGMAHSLELLGPGAFGIRYVDERSQQGQILIRTVEEKPRLLARIREQVPASSPGIVAASQGERIYLRLAPQMVLTWVPGTKQVEYFTLSHPSGKELGAIKSLVPVKDGVCVLTTGGVLAMIRHHDFPADKTKEVLALTPDMPDPAP